MCIYIYFYVLPFNSVYLLLLLLFYVILLSFVSFDAQISPCAGLLKEF